MEISRNKYLFKNTAIFTIGNLATKLITFIFIPIYTNLLTTSEYGALDLVVTICTISVPLITLNIAESVLRFNLDKNSDSSKITKIGIIVLLGGFVVGISVIPICYIFEGLSNISILVYLFVVFSASSQVFLCDLKGKEKLISYSIGNILCAILVSLFNILFLVVLHMGIQGYLLAYIISYAVITIYSFILGKSYKSILSTFDKKTATQMLRFSIVLIPNSFMWWIMNSSDHVMVTIMISAAANGIYAISYKLPTLISTFAGIFNQAWQYSAIKEEESEDKDKYTNSVFRCLIGVMMIVGTGMMALIKPFLSIYVSSDFFEAWQYTPFLIIGCVFLALGTFVATSYTVHKDSFGFLISGVFGAILNIGLNFLLIPKLGVFGAAFATCVSYISVFIFRLIHSRKYMLYNVINKEFVVGSITMVLVGLLMFSDELSHQILQVILTIVLMVVLRKDWTPFVAKIFTKKK